MHVEEMFMDLRGRSLGFLVVSVLVLAVFGSFSGSFRVSGSDEASETIDVAKDSIQSAFKVVLDAEAAGGNVSGLLAELDEAGRLLAGAEMAYRNGDTSTAVGLANACVDKAEVVASEASVLRDSASASLHAAFLGDIVFSVSGVIVVLVVLALVWRWFKREYVRRLLKLKPEVASDAKA